MEVIQLPDGNTVTIRDSVNVRGRKALERTAPSAFRAIQRRKRVRAERVAESSDGDAEFPTMEERMHYTEAEMDSLQRFEYAAFIAWVKHWSMEEELPRSIDEVEELDPELYEAVAIVTRKLAWKGLKSAAKSALDENPPDDAMTPEGQRDLDHPTGGGTGSANVEPVTPSASADQSITNSLTSPENTTTVDATQG